MPILQKEKLKLGRGMFPPGEAPGLEPAFPDPSSGLGWALCSGLLSQPWCPTGPAQTDSHP